MRQLEEVGLLGDKAIRYGGPDQMVMVSGGPASHLSQHSILCGPSKRRFIVRQPNIPPASPHQPSKGEIHLAKQTQPLVGHVEEWKHGCWYHATSIFGETMADLLGKLQELSDPEPFLPTPTNGLPTRPFWSGTLAYDLVQWTQPLALQHPPKEGEILAVLWLIERFAAERKSDGDITAFACDGDDWAALANSVQTKPYEGVNSHENPHQETSNLTDQEHQQGIEAIREGIAAGEFYQVNLGRWWEGQLSRHPRTIFEELCTTNPAPFSAYLCAEDLELALVSSSPESLLQSDGDIVRTAPIKGTRPRGSTKEAEVLLRNEMLNDEKERAEHRMLVDLMRNDLGAVSDVGGVRIERFDVEAYANVQHLVSQVVGTLSEGQTSLDALQAVFPGGSITGCPRTVVCATIDELEQRPRSFWTGSIGWIDLHSGACAWNILIRTLIATKDRARWFGAIAAGGGITIGSLPESEVEEAKWKAAALRKACGWHVEQRESLPTGELEIHSLEVEPAPVATEQGSIRIDDGSMETEGAVLLVDNLDSFTHNIAHAIAGLGHDVIVHQSRTSTASLQAHEAQSILSRINPSHIVLGPGPGQPKDSPITMQIATSAIEGHIEQPVLGICLGHQALGLAAGMELIKVPTGPVHGSPRSIRHSDGRLFEGFTSPHSFTLYNSLVLTNEGASSLNQVAWNETTGDIMGVQHPEKQIFGVQFHPESVGSENGINVLSNFLGMRADA